MPVGFFTRWFIHLSISFCCAWGKFVIWLCTKCWCQRSLFAIPKVFWLTIEKLNFDKHIQYKISKCNKLIGIIKRLSKMFSHGAFLTIYKLLMELFKEHSRAWITYLRRRYGKLVFFCEIINNLWPTGFTAYFSNNTHLKKKIIQISLVSGAS